MIEIVAAVLAAIFAENKGSATSISNSGSTGSGGSTGNIGVTSSITPYLGTLYSPVTPPSGIGSGYTNPTGSTQIIQASQSTSTGGTQVTSITSITQQGAIQKTQTITSPVSNTSGAGQVATSRVPGKVTAF
jgi:hypothetical protein